MPTYHYRCKSCSFEFEEFQKISDEPLKTCPSCKKDTIIRMIGGGAGLVFKGSGFYQTDYKKTAGDQKEKPAKKDEKNTDSKPESKSGTKSSESSSEPSKGDSGS